MVHVSVTRNYSCKSKALFAYEAKQSILSSGQMECRVASLLAMAGKKAKLRPMTVIPRDGGVSSAPRPFDFITDAFGILDHPLSRAHGISAR
jgi:hypothetical protein